MRSRMGLAARRARARRPSRRGGRRGAEPRVVKISAKRFAFTPSEVHVKKGETVVLELTSEDRVHGFNLPAFKIRKDIVPKEVTRVTLTPDKAGTFPFRCDVFCGDGHEDMTGHARRDGVAATSRARGPAARSRRRRRGRGRRRATRRGALDETSRAGPSAERDLCEEKTESRSARDVTTTTAAAASWYRRRRASRAAAFRCLPWRGAPQGRIS